MKITVVDKDRRRLHAMIVASRKLTSIEKLILSIMVENGGDPFSCDLTISDLSWYSSATQATTMKVVKRLRELELIQASVHPKDARRFVHTISGIGSFTRLERNS